MEYMTGFFAFLGFLAFLQMGSLKNKVSKLERQLRENEDSKEGSSLNDLRESLQKRVGKNVRFEFYDDEEDLDLCFATKNEFIKIVDVDENWVLIHAENKNRKIDKLIRISSIKGVEE